MTLRAAIWKAVSSEVQASEDKLSLKEQDEWARSWCQAHDATIVAVLTVDGHPRSEPDIFKLFQDYEAIGCDAYSQHYELCRRRGFDVLLAWSDDRLGRAPSIITHIIDMTVSVAGATVELKHGGTINKANKNIRMGMSVASVPTQLDQFKERRHFGMNKRAEKGLPTSSGVHTSHKLIRDERGKASRLAVDETKRRLFDDLATLILEGVAWLKMPMALYQLGHAKSNGKPYTQAAMYSLVMHPVFWGHSARFFSEKKFANGYKRDLWVFDENEPLPEGVKIWRNTHEAVWTGELAEKIQAELRRRRSTIRGRANPHRTHWFSGLLICYKCSYNLVFKSTNQGFKGYHCKTHERHVVAPQNYPLDCDQNRHINEQALKTLFESKLREALERRTPFVFDDAPQSEPSINNVQKIESEIVTLEDKISRAIQRQIAAPENVQHIYVGEIKAMSEQLQNLSATLQRAKRDVATYSPNERIRALEELERLGGVDALWEQPGAFVNQFLHRFMGNRRLAVLDGKVRGTADAPPFRRH
jgi:hypothetical protein